MMPVSGVAQKLEAVTPAPQGLTALPFIATGRMVRTALPADGFGGVDYASQWPGSYFDARFHGAEVYLRVRVNHEILHVIVDGRPPLVLVKPAPGVYRVAGLADADHSVRVRVATESQSAPNHFGGFALPAGERALQPIAQVPLGSGERVRQIEFIGDSHTVGYGNTSATHECTQDQVFATTDDTQAFGPVLAARMHAAYQVNAISGRGVVRNYDGFAADTLPEAYPYVLFDKAQLYNDPAWQPQVIVIALGTNDFSTPLNAGERWKTRDELHASFEQAYLALLSRLRTRNPRAQIILWATDLANGEIENEARKVTAAANAQGDTRVTFIAMDHLAFTGCHSHPSVADDRVISDKLAAYLDAHPQVWRSE